MKPIPITPEIEEVARRIVWFEPPAQAVADPARFMAYAMRYATHEDMKVIRSYVSDEDFREALDKAPPGIIDPRSWAYWNSKMGRYLCGHRLGSLYRTPMLPLLITLKNGLSGTYRAGG